MRSWSRGGRELTAAATTRGSGGALRLSARCCSGRSGCSGLATATGLESLRSSTGSLAFPNRPGAGACRGQVCAAFAGARLPRRCSRCRRGRAARKFKSFLG